jgi:hypothetical protein
LERPARTIQGGLEEAVTQNDRLGISENAISTTPVNTRLAQVSSQQLPATVTVMGAESRNQPWCSVDDKLVQEGEAFTVASMTRTSQMSGPPRKPKFAEYCNRDIL